MLKASIWKARGQITTVMWLCLALALVTAVTYFLLGASVLQPPGLEGTSREITAVYIAGACYTIGGFLILLGNRWLWIAGAVVNVAVIAIYVAFYATRPNILFCLPGVITKVAQILLEVGLIYLILTYKPERREAGK